MTPPMPSDASRMRWALVLLLLLALALRLFQLGTGYFWMDEIATVFFIRLPWAELFGTIARLEPSPPGHYALLKLLRPVLGEGEWGLRLPSALAGAAAVLPVFLFTRRAFGPRAALAAGLLLALAGQHVIQSQEARNYATLFLLAAIVLAALEAGLEAPGRRGPALLLAQGPLWAAMLPFMPPLPSRSRSWALMRLCASCRAGTGRGRGRSPSRRWWRCCSACHSSASCWNCRATPPWR